MSYDIHDVEEAMKRVGAPSGAIRDAIKYLQMQQMTVSPMFSGIGTVGQAPTLSSFSSSQFTFVDLDGNPINVGDRVSMSLSSQYLFQCRDQNGNETDGRIEGFDSPRDKCPVHVRWDNGSENVYPCDVLLLVDEMKKKKKAKTKLTFDPDKLDALVIDQKTKDEIVAVLQQHKNHDKLFDEWGLGEIIEYGRGMTFMFYGGPGTGKTWGANCIAKALGTELLVVSAAEIQSSEPGGANRAIQEAFKEARSKGKVVFLDECDSLIASRNDLGMVLASEVNTLLTEIEKFEGVAILATNRVEHMDEALERRISLIVEFPNPDFDNRKKIWEKLLPKKMPLGKSVSVPDLAKEELTGGQIKNVVLQAARMALAGDCKEVDKKHFDLAMARIKKSKNLMGSASRYRQGTVRDDFTVGSGKKSKTRFKDFLKTDIEVDEEVETDGH